MLGNKGSKTANSNARSRLNFGKISKTDLLYSKN